MTRLKLLFTNYCGGCEKASRLVEKVRPDFPDLQVEQVNLLDHPEEARRYGLLTTPGVVIDDRLEFAGSVREEELRQKLAQVSRRGGSHA